MPPDIKESIAATASGEALIETAFEKLRRDSTHFSPEELKRLASLDLPDPDPQEVERFLQAVRNSQKDVDEDESEPPAEQLSTKDPEAAPSGAYLGDWLQPSDLTLQNHVPIQNEDVMVENLDPEANDIGERPLSRSLGSAGIISRAAGGGDGIRSALQVLPKTSRNGNVDAVAEALLQVHHIDLIDQGLQDTSPVEAFLNATHVFIQHNHIEELDGLQLLFQLKVLVVHHNNVRSMTPLGMLPHLSYVDVSYNAIENFNMGWDLPDSITVLDVRHNPCCPSTNNASDEDTQAYRKKALQHYPALVELDGKSYVDEEDNDDEESNRILFEQPAAEAKKATAKNATKKSVVDSKPKPPINERGTKQLDKSANKATKRRTVVEEARSLRGVKFDLPESDEPQASPTLEYIPYPKYDTTSLGSNSEVPQQERLTAPVDNMLEQYQRRTAALMSALREESVKVNTERPKDANGNDDDWKFDKAEQTMEELRLARQVRNKTRSNLDYACMTVGRHSHRTVEDLWSDVEKVVKTRHALVAERQKRLDTEKSSHSAAYLESIALLKKELRTKDIEKYRNGGAQESKKGEAPEDVEGTS